MKLACFFFLFWFLILLHQCAYVWRKWNYAEKGVGGKRWLKTNYNWCFSCSLFVFSSQFWSLQLERKKPSYLTDCCAFPTRLWSLEAVVAVSNRLEVTSLVNLVSSMEEGGLMVLRFLWIWLGNQQRELSMLSRPWRSPSAPFQHRISCWHRLLMLMILHLR